MAKYHGLSAHFVGYGPVWPEQRIERTYCGYCTRQHREGLTLCEGCGAPGRIDALQAYLDEFDRVEVTTFGDSRPQFIDVPKRHADRVLR